MATDNERNDINLCFQALGIDFGATPEEVEKAYQRMLAEIEKKKSSADPAKRAEAAADLALANDLYDKIKNSVTYNTKLNEQSHAASLKQQTKKENIQQFKICPSCNKTIGASLQKCPYCREPIRTPFEASMHKLFSGPSLAIIIIVLILVIAGVLFVSYKDLLKKPTAPPEAALPATGTFSNQSGSATGTFSNLSGAVQKP
ncbi:MAG: hypothetical protein H6Q56_260 [Deltaproteobacteria bacterium]|nr:hypothetical protein [Deltaproteobacteria bacterium]